MQLNIPGATKMMTHSLLIACESIQVMDNENGQQVIPNCALFLCKNQSMTRIPVLSATMTCFATEH